MGSRSRRIKEARRRNDEQRGLAPADEQPLAHRRLEERALREGWLCHGDEFGRIRGRLLRVIDREDIVDGIDSGNDRYAISAAKALIGADINQRRLDLAREQLAARVYAEASDSDEARDINEPPADPAVYDWYSDSCPCGLPAGDCRDHPRARGSQRPPDGDWRVWAYVAGRGAGKTRAGASWIQSRVDSGALRLGALIAPTAADIRDVMVEGPSGLLAVAPPWSRPVFEPSKRRLTWPNGARCVCITGSEPERARGLNTDTLWCDELAAWDYPQETWQLAILTNRHGADPRALITTTPKRVAILRQIVDQKTTARTSDNTYANKSHLAPAFLEQITSLFEGTRLGRQELYAEFLDTTDGVWFATFDPVKHVLESAEYHPGWPVRLAIDAGTSRHTGAVFFQVREDRLTGRRSVNVFGEYLAADIVSINNATAIKARAAELPCAGKIDLVRLDPAASARSSLGPAAYGEYERVFGSRVTARWPQHLVLDGLDTIELLLETGNLTIHPRCVRLKEAFQNYSKKRSSSGWIDFPADGHPEEDMMDALRGGVRDAMPEGSATAATTIRPIHATRLH